MLESHEYDKRWTIRDKISQYRGIVSLYQRDKDNRMKEWQRELEEGQERLNLLKTDIHLLRLTLSSQEKGDFTRIQNTLDGNRRLYLANKNKNALEILENLQQINCIKIKKRNKLQHLIKLRMDHLEKTMVEMEELKKRTENGYTADSDFQKKQLLLGKIEKIKVCNNGAKCVNHALKRMTTLMKEDSLYLDHMIAVMSQDANHQYECISSVKLKREKAQIESERILSEYQALEEETTVLMHLQERAIRYLRQQVHHQTMKIKNLGRELDLRNQVFKFDSSDEPVVEDELSTPILLQQLEETAEYLQNVTIVTDFTLIFPRLQEQLEQRIRLRKQLSLFEKQWESYHLKREYAREYLTFLKTYHPDKNERLVEEEQLLKSKIKEVICDKEKNFKKIEWLSKKILIIKSAMSTISELLNRIRIPDELPSLNSIEVEPTLEEIIYKTKKPMKMLELIKERVKMIIADIGSAIEEWPYKTFISDETAKEIDLEKQIIEVKALKEKDPNIVNEANKEFHDEVSEYCSKIHFGEQGEMGYRIQEELYLETGILTRTDVKATSKRIVQNNETPVVHLSSRKGLTVLSSPKKSPKRTNWLKLN